MLLTGVESSCLCGGSGDVASGTSVGPFSAARLCAGLQSTEATLDLPSKHEHLRYVHSKWMSLQRPPAARRATTATATTARRRRRHH